MYLVLVKCLWENLKINLFGNAVPVGASPDGSIGYCPIYETAEEAEKEWPDAQIFKIAPTDAS